MFKLKDRKNSDFLLAPTHEEEITQLVAGEVSSYKQLPLRLYQIGRKYRDEIRPRMGLLRAREFLMKDLYTFDSSEDAALATYEDLSLIMVVVGVQAEADTGNIGGTRSHEYHILSSVGEDTLLNCKTCGYTANEERAVGILLPSSDSTSPTAASLDMESVEIILRQLDETITADLRPLLHESMKAGSLTLEIGIVENNTAKTKRSNTPDTTEAERKEFFVVFLAGNRRVNGIKVNAHKAVSRPVSRWIPPSEAGDAVKQAESPRFSILVDTSCLNVLSKNVAEELVAKTGSAQNRTTIIVGDFHVTEEGDGCPACHSSSSATTTSTPSPSPAPSAPSPASSRLESVRAIEAAHAFYLGTKYSKPLGAVFKDSAQRVGIPIEMGCFGIGVSRLVAAVSEVSHDSDGLKWPAAVAPYTVCVVPFLRNPKAASNKNKKKQQQQQSEKGDDQAVVKSNAEIMGLAEQVYDAVAEGIGRDSVIMDDRDAITPGFKMKDGLLVGYPYMVIVSSRVLESKTLEIQERATGEKHFVPLSDVKDFIKARLGDVL
ncbi:prolyl-tRNA synthetase [Quaeritorhiza haematococci]|nr:prolyl-tRNA synthetase [Quaeritorhiza haematococci]